MKSPNFKKYKIIIGILVFLIVLEGVYLFIRSQSVTQKKEEYAKLILQPNPLIIASDSKEAHQTLTVRIEAKRERISGADLEFSYDPYAMKNVTIEPASFFEQPVIEKKQIDEKNG